MSSWWATQSRNIQGSSSPQKRSSWRPNTWGAEMPEAPKSAGKRPSAFAERGLAKTVQALCEEIRELYLCDAIPWVVGYSGGKDSSAVLQLVWLAIRELAPEQRTKPIHVITTDTLV